MVNLRPFVCVSALAAGCVVDPVTSTVVEAVAVPGPWQPSAMTRAIAATQHVTVVDPPAVSPLGRCTSTNAFACSCTHPACMTAFPGTRELNTYLLRRFTYLRAGGTYCCRQNSATTRVPTLSVHATGRAIDLMVPMAGGDADNTLGDAVAAWLVENAEYIGIQRVVWDRAFWNGERGFGLLSSASLPHTDHLHVELSVAGAERRTVFFTSGASMNTSCNARCEGSRLIRADCTSTDCASSGAACLAGSPPRCGDAPPPEPTEARAVPNATVPSVRTTAAPARFTFVAPTRLFDTRTPASSARLVRSGAQGPVTPTSNGTFRDWSAVGVPAGATGVWLNVAAVGAGGAGYATVLSAGESRPPISTVNYVTDIARANATPAVLGANGGVTFETINPAHVITDLYGAFTPTGAGLVAAGPRRVLDTRSDVALAAGVTRTVDVSAPAGAVGVVASVAVVAGAEAGFLQVFPCGAPTPETSNLNFAADAVVNNAVVSALGSGQLCLRSNVSAHAIVDVTGYLTPTGALTYTALSPQRLLDTRDPASLYTGRLGARQVIELPIQRMPGMPANAVAVVANLTAVSAAERGFVTAFPCGAGVPNTSSLNFPTDAAVGALTVSSLGAGSLCVFSSVRTHLIVDVLGVWTGAASTPAMPPDPVDDGDDLPPEGTDAGVVPADVATPTDHVTPTADSGAVVETDASESHLRDGAPVAGSCGCRAPRAHVDARALAACVVFVLACRARRRRARSTFRTRR